MNLVWHLIRIALFEGIWNEKLIAITKMITRISAHKTLLNGTGINMFVQIVEKVELENFDKN